MSADNSAFLPLSEALRLPVFQNCRIVGGISGVHRPVSGVNITDIPDYYNWIHEGELLVTNCFGIKDDVKALQDFIPTLDRHSLAGVCIKPKRFIDEITPEMIEFADELDFPLIELAPDVNFIDITKSVFDALLTRQTEFTQKLRSINDMLINLIAGGSDLDEIAHTLSMLVGNSVLITDSINSRSALHLTPNGSKLINKDNPSLENTYSHILRVDDKPFGFVYIYPTDTSITHEHKDIVEMLTKTIPLEIARERSVRATENVRYNDFILHLFNDTITNERREYARARSYGMNLSYSHMVVRRTVSERPDAQSAYTRALQRALFNSDLNEIMLRTGVSYVSAHEDEEELLILSDPPENTGFADIQKQLGAITAKLSRRYPDLQLHIGYSLIHSGLSGLKQSANEAKTALKVCKATKDDTGGVVGFNEIGLYRLIYASDPTNEIRAYIEETIGPLIHLDETRRVGFIPMLEAYFLHNGNLKKLSEKTFTHYNTVVYRLKRVKELTGLDPKESGDRFRLETALNLHKLTKMEGA